MRRTFNVHTAYHDGTHENKTVGKTTLRSIIREMAHASNLKTPFSQREAMRTIVDDELCYKFEFHTFDVYIEIDIIG